MSHPQRPRIILARGPQACEKALRETVEQELADLGAEVLQRPVHLLVPSHSLRNHLLYLWVRQQGGVAGLGCHTLRGLARDILERGGESPAPGAWMVPLLVRRAAQQQPALRSCLDHLHDGYASLVGPVTDLLEAGLDPAHSEAIDEVLAEEGRLTASVAEVQRARGLIRVATRVQEDLVGLGFGHISSLLQRATELLRTDLDLHFPSSSWHIYGFADATGVATDLIEAVLLRFGGTVYLDHPPDPADPTQEDPSFEFSRRFATRLEDLGKQERRSVEPDGSVNLQLISALGCQAEVREIGWRIRRLLDEGAEPETIGIVARQMEPYRSSLRTHLERLGVPFSAIGAAGPLLPHGRRIRALLEVLSQRERVRLERWLDARKQGDGQVPDFDLRLAMFGLGVGRLEELAELQRDDALQPETFALPVRMGYSSDEDDGTDLRLVRRQIPTQALREARDQAIDLSRLLKAWTKSRAWSSHREHLNNLLSLLGWSISDPETRDLQRTIDHLSIGVPPDMNLDMEELTLTLTDALQGLGSDPLGGQGGGVQILEVIEARGRTFDHLFVLGLNKGVFPRNIREDSALPDSLRQVMSRHGHGVLPDLPLKRAGFAEERFLFAQLAAASPRVTLSWQVADDDNRQVTPSPLVERLLWKMEPERVSAPQTMTPVPDPIRQPSTAYESAIRAALIGSSRQIKATLTRAQMSDLSVAPGALTEARLNIAAELDRPPGDASRLGPYFGFVGTARDHNDPRLGQDLYITTLERFAVCPWQSFLQRLLRLDALPDPVEILPGLDPFLIGQVVHGALETVVASYLPQSSGHLEDARHTRPQAVPWPEPGELKKVVRRQATDVARGQGIQWPGFADILGEVSLPYLEQTRQLLWEGPDSSRPVAVETEGLLRLDESSGRADLHFRVDRVDNIDGRLRLTDYKTNRRGVSQAKTRKTREKHLIAEIGKGRLLQAAAYAKAAGQDGDQGAYVFVHPEFKGPEDTRIVTVEADDAEAMVVFEQTVHTLTQAWRAGIFFPRLVEADADREPRACEYCSVAEACLRGDSSLRGRLRDWSTRNRPATDTDRVFLETWFLDSKRDSVL